MKKIWLRLCFFLVCVTLFAFTTWVTASAVNDTEVIRVGYMLNYATVKSPVIEGSEGYGYEYLNTIFDYAEGDYTLQFIYCEWENGKKMLERGELDILGPTSYSEAGEELYCYSQKSFGENVIFLSALGENNQPYKNYMDINGSTIAVQANNPNEYMLHDFLEEHRLSANIVYFSDNDYVAVLQENDYDFCLASSLQTFSELLPVVSLGSLDTYYVTHDDDEELMTVIDNAMEEVRQKEFLYQTNLYLKYYNYTVDNVAYITDAEYTLLQNHGTYQVGMENLYSPICYRDENGQLQGMAVDALDILAETAGIAYEIVELAEDTDTELLSQVDVSFMTSSYTGWKNTKKSDIYYEIPIFLVERCQDGITQSGDTIGTLAYYGITAEQMENQLFGRTIFEYSNVQEMIDSYNRGEIDSMILATPALNMARSQIEDMSFLSSSLDIELNMAIIFPEDVSSVELDTFNKLISHLDKAQLDASVLKHSATINEEKLSLDQYIEDYPSVFYGSLIFIFLCFVATELKGKHHLSNSLNVDSLTGLATEHKFMTDAKKILARKNDKKYAILTIDIDNFKYINEFYGYEVGSKILKQLGALLKVHATSAVVIARGSSDQFQLLLEQFELEQRVMDSFVNDNGFSAAIAPLVGATYNITFSMGVYEIADRTLDLSFMIDCANTARRLGKSEAVSTFYKFDKEMDSQRIINNDIVASMIPALNNQEFDLFYQPKIRFTTGKVHGAEALVRWRRDNRIISPADFIPMFEKNGFIERLDFYVLDKACQFIQSHPDTPKISINFSGITVIREGMVDRVVDLVDSYGILHEKLDIEITETAFAEQLEKSTHKFEQLRNLGFTISMDDFGVGTSSLNRLKNVPVDTLKIDRAFVVGADGDEKGQHILRSVIQMAKDLNMETVAEGVETKEQADYLTNLGCKIGQGYYFARPMPEEEFVNFIQHLI